MIEFLPSQEHQGSSKGIRVVWDTERQRLGWAKPFSLMELYTELDYARLGRLFNVPIADVTHNGNYYISWEMLVPGYVYTYAEELAVDFTLQGLSKVLPSEAAVTLLRLVFIDCITKQSDRHAGNLAVYRNSTGNVCGLYPAFDNVAALTGSYSNNCLLGRDNCRSYTHREMYNYLSTLGSMQSVYEYYTSEQFSIDTCKMYGYDELMKQRKRLMSAVKGDGITRAFS